MLVTLICHSWFFSIWVTVRRMAGRIGKAGAELLGSTEIKSLNVMIQMLKSLGS